MQRSKVRDWRRIYLFQSNAHARSTLKLTLLFETYSRNCMQHTLRDDDENVGPSIGKLFH